ncbi:5'-nucleotidase C-terminal domain-containing protein [Lapidilactobacillus luobeiensis]|uniref:5'-nucleotidase C-terminal domain-containing protein n=1 Tax=Lapidilactobacillus luobeiensis TaxID=2950371 RepID=UPI0021C2695F|nr:5'-nucleotidase C-terminal domain-containing protein [Lapidilactobacillus luobeiensis]
MEKQNRTRRQYFNWVVVFSLIISVLLGPSKSLLAATNKAATTAATEVVTIMHTNDMHGRLANVPNKTVGMARLKTYRDQIQPTLLVDAGDAMQGLPLSNYSQGMDMVKAMNAVGYDGMTLGNHEFDFGLETALKYQQELNFPIVSANVFYRDGSQPFKSYALTTKKVNGQDKKFALIGLTTPETAYKTHPKNVEKIKFEKPLPAAIKAMTAAIQDGADYFVFMTHLGVDETTLKDEQSTYLASGLAKKYPDKRIFIADGHSHTQLPTGLKFNNVIVGQTGSYLSTVGLMTGTYRAQDATLKAELHSAQELQALPEDPQVKVIVDQAQVNYDRDNSQVILPNNQIKFNGLRDNVRTRETNLGDLIGDVLWEYGQTGFTKKSDFAVVNGGGIRENLEVGPVNKGQIVAVMPFGNTISQITVTGAQIYQMFEHSLRSPAAKDAQGQVIYDENNLPKLGANGGFLQVSHTLQVSYDSTRPGSDPEKQTVGTRVTSIKLNGKFIPRDSQDTYQMATNDFMAAGGDGYTMLSGKPVQQGPSMDTVLLDYMKKVTPATLANYRTELPMTRIVSQALAQNPALIALQQLVTEKSLAGKNVADYTAYSWAAVSAKLAQAQKVLAAQDIAQANVITPQLQQTHLISTTTLQKSVAAAKKEQQARYTVASWLKVKQALMAAEQLLTRAKAADQGISADELTIATTQLDQAVAGLQVAKTTENNKPQTSNTKNKGKNTTGTKGNLPQAGETTSALAIYGLVALMTTGTVAYRLKKREDAA